MSSCLVVGASCRALAEAAHRAGMEVFAIDQFADRDLASVATVMQIRWDDVLLCPNPLPSDQDWKIALAGGMENRLEVVERFEQLGLLLGPSSQQIAKLRDLTFMSKIAFEAGCLFPEVRYGSACLDGDPESWLSKSRRGAGGLHVARWKQSSNNSSLGEEDRYWQRYFAGIPYGCVYFLDDTGSHLILTTRSLQCDEWNGPAPFVYRGSIPESLPEVVRRRLEALGELIALETPMRGWLGVDIVVGPDMSVGILEINPRWTASMELAYAMDGFGWFERLDLNSPKGSGRARALRYASPDGLRRAANDSPDGLRRAANDSPDGSRRAANDSPDGLRRSANVGKAILYAEQDVFLDHRLLEALWSERMLQSSASIRLENRDRWVADIPSQEGLIRLGSPIFSLFARGSSFATTLNSLKEYARCWKERIREHAIP